MDLIFMNLSRARERIQSLDDPLTFEEMALDDYYDFELQILRLRVNKSAIPTLYDMTFQVVKKCIEIYDDEDTIMGTELDELPNSIYTKLYDECDWNKAFTFNFTKLTSLTVGMNYNEDVLEDATLQLVSDEAKGTLKKVELYEDAYHKRLFFTIGQLCRILRNQTNINQVATSYLPLFNLLPKYLPNLRVLHFYSSHTIRVSDLDVFVSLPYLEELTYKSYITPGIGCFNVGINVFQILYLFEHLRNLKKLEIDSVLNNNICSAILDFGEKYQYNLQLKLQHIDCDYNSIDEINRMIAVLPYLQTLNLKNVIEIESLEELNIPQSIEAIDLSHNFLDFGTFGNTYIEESFSNFFILSGCKLVSLSLISSNDLCIDVLQLANCCPNIEKLTLIGVAFPDYSEYQIGENHHFSKLKYFKASVIYHLQENVVFHVLTRPSLKEFLFFSNIRNPVEIVVYNQIFDLCIENDQILSELVKLHLPNEYVNDPPMIDIYIKFMCFAPKLEEIDFFGELLSNIIIRRFIQRHGLKIKQI